MLALHLILMLEVLVVVKNIPGIYTDCTQCSCLVLKDLCSSVPYFKPWYKVGGSRFNCGNACGPEAVPYAPISTGVDRERTPSSRHLCPSVLRFDSSHPPDNHLLCRRHTLHALTVSFL